MQKIKHLINRIAGWVYFATMCDCNFHVGVDFGSGKDDSKAAVFKKSDDTIYLVDVKPGSFFMGNPIRVEKKWSRKGKCPDCKVSTGSNHGIYCKYYKK